MRMQGKRITMSFGGWTRLSPCQCRKTEGANRERSKAAPSKSGSSPPRANQPPAGAGQLQGEQNLLSICTNFNTAAVSQQKPRTIMSLRQQLSRSQWVKSRTRTNYLGDARMADFVEHTASGLQKGRALSWVRSQVESWKHGESQSIAKLPVTAVCIIHWTLRFLLHRHVPTFP